MGAANIIILDIWRIYFEVKVGENVSMVHGNSIVSLFDTIGGYKKEVTGSVFRLASSSMPPERYKCSIY